MNQDAAAAFGGSFIKDVFPPERTDDFFEALFGGTEEGAYDIALRFVDVRGNVIEFSFDLIQRPGKCLACNLTYGLPQVFARHPVVNVKGVAEAVATALGANPASVKYELLPTREYSTELHCIPLIITVV